MKDKIQTKKKIIVFISTILLLTSIFLQLKEEYDLNVSSKIFYEYINIKDMSQATVTTKMDNKKIIEKLFQGDSSNGEITEVALPTRGDVQEVKLPVLNNTQAKPLVPKRIWYLPTEIGTVTQKPSYGHMALDITSPRAYNENIFPVANGVISGIYRDYAGALIVTVRHNINGKIYTSQYVHLSRYANGLYVGKPVTINDSLGLMGSTGNSTGPHLHLAVLDCSLFDNNDSRCSDLNGFFRYGKQRFNEGYLGLPSQIIVPGSWNSR